MSESREAYRPREFWQERLSEHFDLRGTGHPGCSADYNERCYRLRAQALDGALAEHKVGVAGRSVLDAGCGTGFFVEHYLARGARVTGVDLTEVSVRELSARHPDAKFEVGDLAEWRPRETYDLVSCFDVLFHIVDDEAWDRALTNLADAVAPGGHFVFSEQFPRRRPKASGSHGTGLAVHNVARGWEAYRAALPARGLVILGDRPTHHLMNSELGFLRFLNRFPGLLQRVDSALLASRLFDDSGLNRLVLCRKTGIGSAPR
jgi:2-polyprenyl-3-methyl-5-hydroxy-6-metoxy-1,4-benzoquinol methylase